MNQNVRPGKDDGTSSGANQSKGGQVQVAADAVTARLLEHRRKGKLYNRRGDEALVRKEKLTSFLRYDDAAAFYYKSFMSYKACSRWRDAGDSLIKCARLYVKPLRMIAEAAALYSEAAEIYMKLDKNEALKTYRTAISLYCENGQFNIAGRIERRIAQMHFDNNHWDDAFYHFQRASNFLSGDMCIDQSDLCLEKVTVCMIELDDFKGALKTFELLAESCLQSNLRRFSARDYFMKAILCLLAIPMVIEVPKVDKKRLKKMSRRAKAVEEEKMLQEIEKIIQSKTEEKYDPIVEKIDDYGKKDFLWKTSKQESFLRNIILFRREFNLDKFIDHVFFMNNVVQFDGVSIKMLKVVCDEIQGELQRRADIIIERELVKEKEKERARKFAAAKKLMDDMGMKGEVKLAEEDEEDEEKDEDDAEVANTVGGTGGQRPASANTTGKANLKEAAEKEPTETLLDNDDDDDAAAAYDQAFSQPEEEKKVRRKRDKK